MMRLSSSWALVGLLALGCAGRTRGPGEAALPEGGVVARIERTDGELVSLASLRGRVVLVSILTTWSDPALVEAKFFEELRKEHQGDLEVVAIVLDEKKEMARIFEETFDTPFIVGTVEDPARFTGDRGPFGPISVIPTSVLLDRQGRIAARMDGMWEPELLARAVNKLVRSR